MDEIKLAAHAFGLLEAIGEDVTRGGLQDTPKRVAKAFSFWCEGYEQDPAALFKTFDDGAEQYDQMVFQSGIQFYSHCEHHLAPFFGVVHIGYIPNGRIIGLSKMLRLVDVFAHRLSVQERLTTQIADCIVENLKPLGVGVVVQARHLCIESRGIRKANSVTTTSALRGAMFNDQGARDEFMSLARSATKEYTP